MATEAIIFQQIVDINWDQAIYTASPNNTINVVQFAAKGSGANIGIALTPKGTGYISAQVPDGTAAGGNVRGANSVDLQTVRGASNLVASGQNSVVIGGTNNRASGLNSFAGGASCVSSSEYSFSFGVNCNSSAQGSVAFGVSCNASNLGSVAFGSTSVASGTNSVAIGLNNSATATASVAIGRSNSSAAAHALSTGIYGISYVTGMRSHGNGLALGQAQEICQISVATTTTNSEVECLTVNSTRWVLRSGSVWSGTLYITGNKSDGTAFAAYERQVRIRRVVNTTSLVGTVNTIGTDEAAGTSISITADDTNEALRVGVTGVSGETWTWTAVFHGLEKNI